MLFYILCIRYQTKCIKYYIDSKFNYLSWFKVENKNEAQKYAPFFWDKESQKIFARYERGITKEYISLNIFSQIDEEISIYDKETYSKDDLSRVNNTKLTQTEEDKKIIKNIVLVHINPKKIW